MNPLSATDAWAEISAQVRERFLRNEPLGLRLPGGGRLVMDRQLPFLCIYRRPQHADPGTEALISTQAAYVIGPNPREDSQTEFETLLNSLFAVMGEVFDAALCIEVWAGDCQTETADDEDSASVPRFAFPFEVRDPLPAFELRAGDAADEIPTTVEAFVQALSTIKVRGRQAVVKLDRQQHTHPPGLDPLLPQSEFQATQPGGVHAGGVHRLALGLQVAPVYRSRHGQSIFPLILNNLRRQLAPALRRAVFAFCGAQPRTSTDPERQAWNGAPKFHEALGPHALASQVNDVDTQLCDVADAFDFLLQATPVNRVDAWEWFQASGFEASPDFLYRPLTCTPNQLKRQLFKIPVERVDDPTLEFLLREKQDELDRQISALRDLETPNFRYACLQMYGQPDAELVGLAEELLSLDRNEDPAEAPASVEQLRAQAGDVIGWYQAQRQDFEPEVEVTAEIAASLMVSGNRLMIGEASEISAGRVRALMEHEIGVHLVTHFNGRAQPLALLARGLAGYDALQEGLAVLAECLIGGMRWSRVRTLAARVIAAESLLQGAEFVETFRTLHHTHDVPPKMSFNISLRVHRGGGMTKDALYLRGLRSLLKYLANAAHEIEPLFVGKIALRHVPFVQELRRRGIIKAPRLLPRFIKDTEFRRRFDESRGLDVKELFMRACP